MHRVRIVGVRTLETSRFNPEIGDMENSCKATIKWGKDVKLTEAGIYNNQDCILMTQAEYEALTDGQSYNVPVLWVQGLKTIGTMVLDLVAEAEKEVKR